MGHFDVKSRPLWGHFGVKKSSFMGHFDVKSRPLWGHFGVKS